MTNPIDSLPADVQDAIDNGNVIEAIKRLRQSTGLGLKEAKDIIDARTSGNAMLMAVAQRFGDLPDDVVQALKSGNKIEAIKRMRAHDGLSLKDAKDAVEASAVHAHASPDGHSPGEVPRSNWYRWISVALVAALLAVYVFIRNG